MTEEEMKQDIRTVEQIIDDMDLFDDGSHIVYVNGEYKGNDEIGKLLNDFGCKESKDMYYSELAKGVKHFKEEGGRWMSSGHPFSADRSGTENGRLCVKRLRSMQNKRRKM